MKTLPASRPPSSHGLVTYSGLCRGQSRASCGPAPGLGCAQRPRLRAKFRDREVTWPRSHGVGGRRRQDQTRILSQRHRLRHACGALRCSAPETPCHSDLPAATPSERGSSWAPAPRRPGQVLPRDRTRAALLRSQPPKGSFSGKGSRNVCVGGGGGTWKAFPPCLQPGSAPGPAIALRLQPGRPSGALASDALVEPTGLLVFAANS